jgi:hypothetical protein
VPEYVVSTNESNSAAIAIRSLKFTCATLTVPRYGGVMVGRDQLRQVLNDTEAEANNPKLRFVRLKTAGKSGLTVKDLAAKLGKSYGNISVWFHTTAKGIKEINKVEPGRFTWAS